MAIRLMPHQFTAEEYHRMAAAGILGEDDRVELIDGEVIDMTPIGGEHVACVTRLTRLLSRMVGDDAWVSVQSPVRLGPRSEPQPDVAVLSRLPDGHEPPVAADALLLVEVADTSLVYDLNTKAPLYAMAGIPEVWVVSLVRGEVIRHAGPRGGGWERVETLRGDDRLVAERLPAVGLTVAELFPTTD
ncbi:MAG TPA: Uma2 family endonuclease [Thermomicrobiales bacterium]|nr:Uma2 family endonuclease [Thermomicrobiales bacterium]